MAGPPEPIEQLWLAPPRQVPAPPDLVLHGDGLGHPLPHGLPHREPHGVALDRQAPDHAVIPQGLQEIGAVAEPAQEQLDVAYVEAVAEQRQHGEGLGLAGAHAPQRGLDHPRQAAVPVRAALVQQIDRQAVVTVVVVEGVAVVRGADEAAAVTVSAGETRRIAPAGPAPARAGGTPGAADRHAEVARLEAELADAKQALAEAEFAGAVTRGQLQALQGTPSAWPADVPAPLSPEGFRAGLAEQLAPLGDAVEVVSVDCDEFPCLAVIHNTGAAGGDWNDRVRDAVGGWLRGSVPGPLSVSANTSAFSNGDHTEEYVIFGAHTADRESDVGQRTEYRIDAAISELGEQLREE